MNTKVRRAKEKTEKGRLERPNIDWSYVQRQLEVHPLSKDRKRKKAMSTRRFRVIFWREWSRDKLCYEAEADSMVAAIGKAKNQLAEDERRGDEEGGDLELAERIDDPDEWVPACASELDYCGHCARPYEVGLVHECPKG